MADVELKILANTKEALDSIESFSSNATTALKVFAGAAVAFLGGRAIIGAMDSFIKASSESESAINNMNIAMASAGTYSDKASQHMQDFAASMQTATGISDEMILNQIAIARNFTKTNDAAEKLTKAAIELSAATGKDLDSSVQALAKSLEGVGGALGKTLPATKGFTEAQLKAGAAIDYILSRFSGVAESKMQSFQGAITGVGNAFDDMKEILGDVVTKNSVVISIINIVRKGFIALSDVLKKNKGVLEELVTGGLKFLISMLPSIIRFIEGMALGFGYMTIGIYKTISIVSDLISILFEMKPVILIINAVKDAFLIMGTTILKVLGTIFELITYIPGIGDAFNGVTTAIKEFSSSLDNKLFKDSTEGISSNFAQIRDSAEKNLIGVSDYMDKASSVMDQLNSTVDDSVRSIEGLSSAQINSGKKAVETLNANSKGVRLLALELEEIKKKGEEAFKKPYDFIIRTVLETAKKTITGVSKTITEIQTWVADHPLNIEMVSAGAGLLDSIFKSGAGSVKKIQDELVAAIDGARAQLDAAINEINQQKQDALLLIEGDFTDSVAVIQKQLEDGSLTQVEYQDKINALEKKRLDEIKAANKKASDSIQAERVKNETEIAKLRADNAIKINEQNEKNVQAAAKVAGSFADAVGAAFGLPPIFSSIINMLSAPPDVWKGIIDGLAAGIPTVIQRIVENIPVIITAIADAMPGLIDAIQVLLTDPNFWTKIALAFANAFIAEINAGLKLVLITINNLGLIFADLFHALNDLKTATSNLFNSVTSAGINFINRIIEGGKAFVSNITEGIKLAINQAISTATGGAVGGGGIDVIGAIGNAIGVQIPHFATGGIIPTGFSSDNYMASLSSGEMVVPSKDVSRLSAFLDKQDRGGSQIPTTIILQVGEKELASVILSLNRNGFRTS